jgi:hypothetical protein
VTPGPIIPYPNSNSLNFPTHHPPSSNQTTPNHPSLHPPPIISSPPRFHKTSLFLDVPSVPPLPPASREFPVVHTISPPPLSPPLRPAERTTPSSSFAIAGSISARSSTTPVLLAGKFAVASPYLFGVHLFTRRGPNPYSVGSTIRAATVLFFILQN